MGSSALPRDNGSAATRPGHPARVDPSAHHQVLGLNGSTGEDAKGGDCADHPEADDEASACGLALTNPDHHEVGGQ